MLSYEHFAHLAAKHVSTTDEQIFLDFLVRRLSFTSILACASVDAIGPC